MFMATRTRTYSWEDPMQLLKILSRMSGLEALKGILAGEIPPPPLASTLNMQLESVEAGKTVFTIDPAEYHYNALGVLHGGVASTLIDSAMGCAVHSVLPAGVGYATLELHVNFIRPLTAESGRIRCTGEVIHYGKRIATAEARITDIDGKLYNHGTTTCMILSPEA